MQFEKRVCSCLRSLIHDVQSQEQTLEVKLPETYPDIGKVLFNWGQVILRGKEWRSGGMSVTGGVMVWTLYAPEDGTPPRSLESWIPFQLRWSFPETDREGSISVCPTLRSVDARVISARKMMVRVVVDAMGDAWQVTEADVYSPGDIPEGVEILRRSYPVRLPKESGEKSFRLEEAVPDSDGTPLPDKWTAYRILPVVQDQKVVSDKAVFRGSVFVHIVFQDDTGHLCSREYSIPFSQFAELDHTYEQDADVSVQIAVTGLETDTGEDDRKYLKCSMVAQYLVSDREMLNLAQDAYSPSRDAEVKAEDLLLPAILDEREEILTAAAQISTDGGELIDSVFLPESVRIRQDGESFESSAAGSFQVLRYDAEGNLQSTLESWKDSLTLKADPAGELLAAVQPMGWVKTVSAGNTASMQQELQWKGRTVCTKGIPMVTGLTVGEAEEPDPNRPSLILRRVESEELWEIAKLCGSTVDAIRQANGLQQEPSEGQMLLIPVI